LRAYDLHIWAVQIAMEQPNSWRRCAVSRWLFEHMPNFARKWWRECEKFAEISFVLSVLISTCCV